MKRWARASHPSHGPLTPGWRVTEAKRAVLGPSAVAERWLAGWLEKAANWDSRGGTGGKGEARILLGSREAEQETISILLPALSFLPHTSRLGCKILKQMTPEGQECQPSGQDN